MTNALRLGRRALTIGVVGATIAWSIGLASLLQPLTARAYTAGDLIKGSLPAVYYYAADGKRYVFPNDKTYFTWYSDFNGVQTISDSQLAAIPTGGMNVVYRAGTKLVKIQTDPKVYAVETNGKLRWIETEAVASALYGATWATRVNDVPDVFFVDYTPSASLANASMYPSGSLLKNASSENVYYVDGSSKRWAASTGMTANRFQTMNVITTSQNLSVYTDGANITGYEAGLSDTAQTGATPPVGAGLTVSLASDTPASATVPQSAQGVAFLAFNLSSAGSATVTGITAKRFGVGDRADLGDVYLYQGATRLTEGRSINADNEVQFTGLSLPVTATPTKLWVKADINTGLASGGTHGFQIASASKVVSNAGSVTGSFPVSGNLVTVGSADAGTITIDASGTIVNPTIGQDNIEIARFTLAADDEDASVRSISLTLGGTVRGGDLSNLTLWQGATKLAETATVSGRELVIFTLTNPYPLADGATRTFSVHADVGGESDDTVGVLLDEDADISSIGADFGFNMAVARGGYDGGEDGAVEGSGACDEATDDCSFSTIEGGQLTLAFNGPTASDISVDSDDQILMKFSMTAEQFITVKEFNVVVTCIGVAGNCDADADAGGLNNANTEANLQDFRIVNSATGQTLMGPEELGLTAAEDAVDTLTFTEDFTINAGQTIDFLVTADIDNGAVDGDSFTVTLDMPLTDVEDSNGDALTDVVPNTDIEGNEMTLTEASLDIDFTTPPSDNADDAHIKGSNNVPSAAFAFTAGDAEDMTVTAVTLQTCVTSDGDAIYTDFDCDGSDADGTDLAAQDRVASVSLYDSETQALLDGPESVEADGDVVFAGMNWLIPAGQTKKLLVKANISTLDVTDGDDDAFAFDIEDEGDVTAQDEDGDDVTVNNDDADFDSLNGTDAAPTVYIVVSDTGTLAVTADSSTPDSEIVLGGSTDVTMAKYRFTATDESFEVQELTIEEDGAVDNGMAQGDYDRSVSSVKVSYKNQAGATQTSTGFLTAGVVKFSGLSMYVPANGNSVLSVMASVPSIDDSAETGDKIQLIFDSAAVGDFKAVGVSSGEALDGADVANDVEGDTMVIRETKPTISLAAGSPSGGSTPGVNEVFRFTVGAAAGEDVILDMLTFRVTTTDNGSTDWNFCDYGDDGLAGNDLDTTDFTLYDAADPADPLEASDAEWTLLASDGTTCTDVTDEVRFARLDLATPETVAAGTTKTYKLEVDTTGASSVDDDSFRVDITAEPLLSSTAWIDTTDDVDDAAFDDDDTTFDADDGGDATLDTAGFAAGDLICFDEDAGADCDADEEVSLVLSVAADVVTVYRGDLGRVPEVISNNANILRLPAMVVWDDDGDDTTINEISGYLLKNLTVTGGNLVF